MTFENCYIVLWCDNDGWSEYSDEFTCDENELLAEVRKFIEQSEDFSENMFVYVNNEDECFEYRVKNRNDSIKKCIDKAIKSIAEQIKKYVDEQENN